MIIAPRLWGALALALALNLVTLTRAQALDAPASQPSGENEYPRVSCSEWEHGPGKEGKCSVETESTEWELQYYREGKEKLSLQGQVKNLIVVFHPDGNDHKIRDWWNEVIGPGRPLDTDKWLILSLGTLGDGKPSKGSSILLTADEILSANAAIIEYLYPRSEITVGGASRGGQVAILWALRNPKRVRKIFAVGAHGLAMPSEEPVLTQLESISSFEREEGPYINWSREKQSKWWADVAALSVDLSYTKKYFEDPSWVSDQGIRPDQYVDSRNFRKVTIGVWATYFVDTIDPHWYAKQLRTIQSAIDSTKESDFSKLPKDVLLVWNPEDLVVLPKDIIRFIDLLKAKGKKVRSAPVSDPRGHSGICNPNQTLPDLMATSLKNFLND